MFYYPYYWSVYSLIRPVFGLVVLIVLTWILLKAAGHWRMFQKAGEKGWKSLIPFYHSYIEYRITWGNGWMFFVPYICFLLSNIPKVGWLFSSVALVVNLLTAYKTSLAYGHGIGYAIGYFFLNPIFVIIIGFGNSVYHGIPQDGLTYDDISGWFGRYSSDHMEYRHPHDHGSDTFDADYTERENKENDENGQN